MVTSYPQSSPLTRRLELYTDLQPADRSIIERISGHQLKTIAARRDLVKQGDNPRAVYLILEGWACHYRVMRDGRRQIVDFAIPGDLCDVNVYILEQMDTSICALTRLVVAEITRDIFESVTAQHPNITQALWWQELVTKSVHREWIVSVGQRTAEERIAHLLCEMFVRMDVVGLTHGASCDFPLTQIDIADATGLTPVHVNRTLQQLRRQDLILLERRQLTIPDLARLKATGLFNPDYLHLGRLAAKKEQGHALASRTFFEASSASA